jgi:hypothetical protein
MSIAGLAKIHAQKTAPVLEGRESPQQDQQFNTRVSTALEMLTKYIPTEIVALYISALSIAPAVDQTLKMTKEVLYWAGVVAAPVVLVLVFLGNARTGGKPLPPVRDWPYWKAIASMFAFAAWGVAIPGNWWVSSNAQLGLVAGFLAIVASYALSIIGRIVDPDPE